MRHSELWERLHRHLGVTYAEQWAESQTMSDLEGRTVREALDAGWPPKMVWRAVHARLELPASER